MTETELRTLVRDVVARQFGQDAPALSELDPHVHAHASHRLLNLPRGGDGDGACLIEPAVRCNHCGYCLSYGH